MTFTIDEETERAFEYLKTRRKEFKNSSQTIRILVTNAANHERLLEIFERYGDIFDSEGGRKLIAKLAQEIGVRESRSVRAQTAVKTKEENKSPIYV